jgi:hypothetical protein
LKFSQVIDGDENDDDPLAYPRTEANVSNVDQPALPPSIHNATEVSFDSSSSRNHDLTKSNNSRWDHIGMFIQGAFELQTNRQFLLNKSNPNI